MRPRYNAETGDLLGLHETTGFIIVRGDFDEDFFDDCVEKQKSKVLCSHYKRRIPNEFSGTIFNRHKRMIESGVLESDMSHLYIFIPAMTDCCENINQYMNNVSLIPIDIKQSQFNAWADNSSFTPFHLDMSGLNKSVATETMV